MKKILVLLVVLLACVTTACAQFYVGGTLGFTSTKVEGQSGTSYKIIPDFGYQLNDNMSAGIQIGYSHGLAAFGSLTVTDIKQGLSSMISGAVDINNDQMKLNSFTVSPYFRYNLVEFDKARLFVEAYVGYHNISAKVSAAAMGGNFDFDDYGDFDDDDFDFDDDDIDYGDSEKTTLNAFEVGIRPGISLQVSDKVDVVCKMGALGYVKAKEKESKMSISRFGLDFDTYNLLLGVNFHF